MSLISIIQAIQDMVGAVTGIRAAPDYLPDSPISGLMSVVYPASGELLVGDPAGQMLGLHTIVVEIIMPRKEGSLRPVLQTLYPYGVSIPLALAADVTLGDTAETFGNISYTFGSSFMYGDPFIGWIFRINNVKTHDTY